MGGANCTNAPHLGSRAALRAALILPRNLSQCALTAQMQETKLLEIHAAAYLKHRNIVSKTAQFIIYKQARDDMVHSKVDARVHRRRACIPPKNDREIARQSGEGGERMAN